MSEIKDNDLAFLDVFPLNAERKTSIEEFSKSNKDFKILILGKLLETLNADPVNEFETIKSFNQARMLAKLLYPALGTGKILK